jgi:hypothetical protein
MVSKRVIEFVRFLATVGGELIAWLLFLFKAAEHRVGGEVSAWRHEWRRLAWVMEYAGPSPWRRAHNAKSRKGRERS